MGFLGINTTQLILYGGAAIAIYYLYSNKLPPFDKFNLEFPSFGSSDQEPKIEAVSEGLDGASPTPDVVPGKEGIVADFYTGGADYPIGGGTSGDLEDDFFITLARQKALLGDQPYGAGGGYGGIKETGDVPLYQKTPGQATNYNNITFDKYGNTVIVPIPQNTVDIASCRDSCMISCGNIYGHDPAMKEACESGCQRVCSVHYSPPSSVNFQFDQYPYGGFATKNLGKGIGRGKGKMLGIKKEYKGKGKAYGRKQLAGKSYISRHASKINATMPYDETEVLGVGHREKHVNIKSLIQAKMMLRPMVSSRTPRKLTCGKSEVCNV